MLVREDGFMNGGILLDGGQEAGISEYSISVWSMSSLDQARMKQAAEYFNMLYVTSSLPNYVDGQCKLCCVRV